jgi:long-chain acyl-CoA synthetase
MERVETLISLFRNAVKQTPNEEKIVDGEMRLSLAALAEQALGVAKIILRHRGAGPENVAVLLPNSIGFIAAFFGILLSGKTVVPVNYLLSPVEMGRILKHGNVSLLLTGLAFSELARKLSEASSGKVQVVYLDQPEFTQGYGRTTVDETLGAISAGEKEGGVGAEDAACLLYTSGTQARAKGVVLSHRNLAANYRGCRELMEIGPQDVFLCVLPLFHSFAITAAMLLPLLSGARLILQKRFMAGQTLKLISDERINVLMLVPAMYELLVKSQLLGKMQLGSVRYAISGGGPLSPLMEKAFEEATGIPLLNGYGLTEAAPVVSVNLPWKRRAGSIGSLLPNVRVEVWDDQGERLECGKIGEIMVKGDNVMKGYYGWEEETRQVITEDRWLHTGDCGFLDEDGFLYITGRKKDLIIYGGENIHPQEIEHVIASHPAVELAAVVGVHDKVRGEYPKAFVKLKENCRVSARELKEFCREHLAAYKVPREVEFLADLPRNVLGKVLKHLLVRAESRDETKDR